MRRPAEHLPSLASLVRAALMCSAVGAVACSDARPVVDGTASCTTWTDVKPVLASQCVSCHSGANPDGHWDATTYLGAIGVPAPQNTFFADTTPSGVVKAGDASSRLLTVLTSDAAVPEHRVSSQIKDLLRGWVVDCRLSFAHSKVHAGGLLNPADPDFHAKLLASKDWNFKLCQKCHGDDFSGGKANVSCLECHKKGPTDCTTCHEGISHDGNHGAHLTGPTLDRKLECSDCHHVPAKWDELGHIVDANGKRITTPAKVTFGALANATPAGVTRLGPATFNASDQSCSNVYCHGGAFSDSNANVSTPKWTDGSGDAACGACHGLPPANHKEAKDCVMCHGDVVADPQHLADKTKHITGTIYLKDGITSPDCTACHGGDYNNPAPPRDLAGNTSVTAIGVGAHQVHLNPTNNLAPAMACSDCHAVPNNVLDGGHIVTGAPPSVFPSAIASTSKAFADGAQPEWDRSTATCSNVYCHGGGQSFQADQSTRLNRAMVWTDVGTNQAYCGSCHGIPPADSSHTPDMGLTTCATCHPGSVDANGFPIVTGAAGQQTSKHINGVVDYVAP